MTVPNGPRETAVYRLYDADGTLLYVGISYDVKIRFADHKANKDWWPSVATEDVRWFPGRDEAWAEEQRVIHEEHPRWNVASVRWVRGEHGEPPAEVLPISHFTTGFGGTIDQVAKSGSAIVVTRHRMPLVVITPYTATPERAQQISKGVSTAQRAKAKKQAEKETE
ncbi:GIY-YIG nuclease family protein [Streptomyces tauricus]|uniref:GIY-YIG nuclease family protein n=1 Tax=Streptomyces tauricus TaxID=68274 RepID=UPI00387EF149